MVARIMALLAPIINAAIDRVLANPTIAQAIEDALVAEIEKQITATPVV